MKRIFEIILSSFLLFLLLLPLIIIAFVIKFDSKGPIIFWSKRVGINNKIFLMPKFRTMKINTPDKATHLLKDPYLYLTNVGKFLRRFSLDELPQLYSLILGHMTFVGPRPALYNQYDLIKLRNDYKIYLIKPGITGWAQINGRDSITIEKKVQLDNFYLKNKNVFLDIKIIFLTLYKAIIKENILH
jgi:O-antigen biosynthesis protein WbqP